MASKLRGGNVCWFILYPLTGIIDLVQILVDFTGVGIVVSEALEIITPFLLIGILKLFGVSVFEHPRRIISIVAADLIGVATGGVAPFWILDVYYIHRDVKRKELEAAVTDTAYASNMTARQPLHNPGTGTRVASGRSSENQRGPLNEGGVRPPRGGLA